jgi:serine/threonine-protein kinase
VWVAGQKIADYELVANLRSGGMATLFLARRLGAAGFARPVAIKLVHPELAGDPQFRQMFLDEALLSSRIQHPNVVHVEELGEHQGAHYLVMEFVHGCSLAQLTRALIARGRRLSPAFAARIAMHVAEALHAAHETRDERGRLLEVVHRDVSPENILIAYAGHVKLIDFGIAKAYGRRHKTQEGLLKGKFRYMAPEQAYAKPIDRRTDLYQLGIVLWEMLTQRRLFDGENDVALLAQVRDPKIVPPSTRVDRIPPALDAAVMMALAKEPARRPPDAQTFARTLAKAVPTVHDVDSGALSSLVMNVMQEHRQREQATYPPGVYERLEQQIETLKMGAGPRGADTPGNINQNATLEHTAPYGSDSPEGAQPQPTSGRADPRAATAQAATQPAFGSEVSDAARARGSIHKLDKNPRRRRLVRLASELRTTITAIERGLREKRVLWLLMGAAVGLALALALITVVVRHGPHAHPPSLPAPMPPQAVAAARVEAPAEGTQLAAGKADAAAQASEAGAAAHAGEAGTAAQASEAREAAARDAGALRAAKPKRLPTLGSVDGTPLFTEPGF